MNAARLIRSGLRHHWRTHLGVVLGAAVGGAVIVGGLFVGDSVRHTLKRQAQARIGQTQLALNATDRFVRAELAEAVGEDLGTCVAPVLSVRGVAALPDGSARANQVSVLGVDERYWQMGPPGATPLAAGDGQVILNHALAEQLGAAPGDRVVLRVEKPSALPRDVPLAADADNSVALNLVVKAVAGADQFGSFSLRISQVAPFNAFVPLDVLSKRVERSGAANLLLVEHDQNVSTQNAAAALARHWQLDDAELDVRKLPTGQSELRTRRVFLDDAASGAARAVRGTKTGILTYFVNELRAEDRATPYSMVAAIGAMDGAGAGATALFGIDIADDQIVVNQWLADDLDVRPGDAVSITYFALGPGRKLVEKTTRFTIAHVVPIEGLAADRDLMPDFPGLAEADDCRDWEPGIPIDLERIRKKDEDYWDRHRGTPKAFITLKAGQAIWANAYGNLTAVRFEDGAQTPTALRDSIRAALDPAALGLAFGDVRAAATAAATPMVDFGQLFLCMSFFLIVAAALLTALLFVFGVEQRADEIGTLLALGFEPRHVRRLLLGEGAVLAIVGALIGVPGAWLFTRAVLYGLATAWRDAVAGAALNFAARWQSVVIGIAAAVVAALLAMAWTLRRQLKRPARELIAAGGGVDLPSPKRRGIRLWLVVTILAVLFAVVIIVTVGSGRGRAAAGAFFASGALVLIAAISASAMVLLLLGRSVSRRAAGMTVANLAVRNNARRSGRSLAVVALVACGCFLLVGVSANRLDPTAGAARRDSGTGGFALYGETAIPVAQDLNSAEGRAALDLDVPASDELSFVPLRVRDGDDASCLNLNRAQTPRLLGVDPGDFAARGAFSFVQSADTPSVENPWQLLVADVDGRTVPAIADHATLVWALHLKLGQTLTYRDHDGEPFDVKIVAVLADSIFQGNLLIHRDAFLKRFRGEAGFRAFLIEAPAERASDVAQSLSRAMADYGFEATTTARRLGRFLAVQNTYLSVFQTLGGLGLLLGSAGLGMVVLRNVLERRGELAILRAVGFSRGSLMWMTFSEHALLLALGVLGGVVAAIVAVIPALHGSAGPLPYGWIVGTLAAVALSGVLWVWLATLVAQRGDLLEALRRE